MNVGIELLVKRIKDCPDEFVEDGQWNRLMDLYSNYKGCFTEEEKTAVDSVLLEARREVFTGKVMEIIANSEVLGDVAEKYTMKTQGRYATGLGQSMLATGTQFSNAIANSLSIGNETLTEQNLIDIKAKIANLK